MFKKLINCFVEIEDNNNNTIKDTKPLVNKAKLTKTQDKTIVTSKHAIGESDSGQTLYAVDGTSTIKEEVPVDNADKYNEDLINKIKLNITKKFNDNNKSPNFLSFYESVHELVLANKDLKDAINITLNIFNKLNINRDFIIESGNLYTAAITAEREFFESEYNKAYNENVTNIQNLIDSNNKEIELLEKQINKLKQQNEVSENSVKTNKVQLNKEHTEYLFNIDVYQSDINTIISSI